MSGPENAAIAVDVKNMYNTNTMKNVKIIITVIFRFERIGNKTDGRASWHPNAEFANPIISGTLFQFVRE